MKGNKMSVKTIAKIKEESDKYILIKSIVDSATQKPIKRAKSAWALEYNGDKYFNLGYSGDYNHWNLFVKFDIIGKYCAVFIDKKTPAIIKNSGNNSVYYGGGLAGALTGILVNASTKWNKNWKDKEGDAVKILFTDTSDTVEQFAARNSVSRANLLTRDKLRELIADKKTDVKIKDIPFEEVVEIIKQKNSVAP
jgi:hypothetical protein